MKAHFSLVIILVCFCAGCSSSVRKPDTGYTSWTAEPKTAILLSEAVTDGIRYLVNEIFISQNWFKNTEISVQAGNRTLLQSRIAFVSIGRQPNNHLISRWRVLLQRNKNITHVTTFYFDSATGKISARIPSVDKKTPSDKLFLDIRSVNPNLSTTLRKQPPSSLTLTFWRNRSQNEKFAQLRLSRLKNKHYSSIRSLPVLRKRPHRSK